jgi:hypothetical protein
LGSYQGVVHPPLAFSPRNGGHVVSRSHRAHGTPHASSVVTQQEFAELRANSVLHC